MSCYHSDVSATFVYYIIDYINITATSVHATLLLAGVYLKTDSAL